MDNKLNKIVALLSLGCKVNSYETDAMENQFKNKGYNITTFDKYADIYVVNTCTVTNMADRKSRQMLHKAKKMNPDAVVVAVGCYVQASKEEAMMDQSIDIVIGNNQKNKVVEVVENFIEDREYSNSIIDISDEKYFENMNISETTENTRAYIKIQDGCNQFCSYCIIPYARGRIRSRDKEDIIKEVSKLAENGYKEVILTGIHISSYGMDITGSKSFDYHMLMELIDEISLIDGIKRIRLGSLEPRIISEEFMERLSDNKKVCPHFHLSLQSGCDETLKRMNRKYNSETFYKKCEIIRKYFDLAAITTDVIVGFPGETEEEFNITTEFLKKVNFSQMHIFKYSVRKGTVAAKMDNQIDEKIKTLRSKVLLELSKDNHKKYMENFVNTKERVLFEENVMIDGKNYDIGHNERYLKIAVLGNDLQSNSIEDVTVEGFLNDEILLGTK